MMEGFLTGELYDIFPRLHTAIAEWIACVIYILPRTKRLKGWKLYAVMLGFAGLLLIPNYFSETVDGFPWVLLMAACMLVMFLMIWTCCKASFRKAIHQWSHAFLAAEFAASLEWQTNCYIMYEEQPLSFGQTFIAMGIIYLVVFSLLWILNNQIALLKIIPHVSRTDAVVSVVIALLMFSLGNFRFILPGTKISQITGAGILFIRTMTDFAGLLLLYIIDIQRRALYARYELGAMDSLLNRQYEQYQAAEANNEAIQRVYHDLKHQIAFIREEKDRKKKAAYLEQLDSVISVREAQADTGNAVLDTLLTTKNMICLERGITMTVFADAHDAGFLDVMDLCSLFGNAVDNAIEYEQQVEDESCRLIKVTVRTQSRFLLIRIQNYCNEKLPIEDGTIATSKKDKRIHGYGIKSIRRAVEKYDGTLTMEQEDDWFVLKALIPIPGQKEA